MCAIQNYQIRPEIFNNPYLSIQLKGMRAFGYIIGNDQSYQKWHFMRCIFFTLSFIIFCILLFVKVFRSSSKVDADSLSRTMILVYLPITMTVLNACFQRKRVISIINFIHDDLLHIRSCADVEEDQLCNNKIKYVRRITYAVWIPSLMAGVNALLECIFRAIFLPETVFNVPQILNGTADPILLHQLFPFGEVYDHFIIGFVGPCYAMLLGNMTIPLWHTFITSLLNFVILKYEIINKRLREMEQLLRIPVFIDFICFSVLICLILFSLVIIGIHDKTIFFFLICFLLTTSLILWLYYWHATLLTASNQDMRLAIFSCDWYNYSLNVQKSLLMIMMEHSNPLILRAVYVDLKLDTFLDIIRGAFSYFSILRKTKSRHM